MSPYPPGHAVFDWIHNGDRRGVLFYIGTGMGTHAWRNPCVGHHIGAANTAQLLHLSGSEAAGHDRNVRIAIRSVAGIQRVNHCFVGDARHALFDATAAVA
eukprot:gene9433-biopygen5491